MRLTRVFRATLQDLSQRALVLLALAVPGAAALARPDYGRPVVTSAGGEECVAGQLIVQLHQSQRPKIHITSTDGLAYFGIPALDRLSRRWRVDDITRLMGGRVPSDIEKQLGCDLQYVVQFGADQDVQPVLADFRSLPEVATTYPNGVMRLDSVPNDPLYLSQWHLAAIDAQYGWNYAHGDSSVLIVIIDDGLDYQHPDLMANLRVSEPEDINHNGRFDPEWYPDGDCDGLDQDSSGVADDVVGYDLVDGDPDPMPDSGDEHGTHCAGTANAVTDNGIGVSAPPWNVRMPALRCGSNGGVNLGAAISAIYYAISRDAWAISMSFGSFTPYQPLATACLDAWNSGLVLFASAGHDGMPARRYPACYDGVEAVAATYADGQPAPWTTYGEWVDVCAPGVNILSTLPGGRYGTMDGCSPPMVAGVAAWIKSVYPAATDVEALQILHECCEPIDHDLYRQGQLGAGIVNMGNVAARRFNCNLSLAGWRVNDATGNGNGRPDPGETCAVIVSYANHPRFQNATTVRAAISCSNPEFILVKDTATFPDIPAGDTADCSADSFVIFMPDSAPPQPVVFSLVASATPAPFHPNSSFDVRCGDPHVLLVDDDDGRNYERFYTAALDSNRVLCDTWSVLLSGSPSAETLCHYPVVIWFCGDDSTTTLTTTDRINLSSYLDGGGNLFIAGQNIAQGIAGDAFLSDYMHARFVDDSTGGYYLVGAVRDPVMDGDTAVLAGAGGAANNRSADGVLP